MKKILITIIAFLAMVQISHAVTYKTLKLFGDQSYFLVTGMILDYDTTLAANSDQRIPTQKALKAYIDTSISSITPISGGSLGQIYRYGVTGAGWSTSTFADSFPKGSFLYNATANTVDAFVHPGAAYYLIATNSADGVGYFASSADVIAILGSADAATFRANAGLAIGTNIQAYSAVLAGIGATTPAAGMLGYTGAIYDWYTGISLSNNSLRHFYDETAGYYSNSDCTAAGVPAACCTGSGTGTCAPKYIGMDPVNMTGTYSAIFRPVASGDVVFTNDTVAAGTYKHVFKETANTFTAANTFNGDVTIGDATSADKVKINLDAVGIGDAEWNGTTITLACGEDITAPAAVYVKSDGKAWLAKADAIATMPAIGLMVETCDVDASESKKILIHGVYRKDASYAFTVGALVYVDDGTAGLLTSTVGDISGTDHVVQVVGVALDADYLLVNPSFTMITLE